MMGYFEELKHMLKMNIFISELRYCLCNILCQRL